MLAYTAPHLHNSPFGTARSGMYYMYTRNSWLRFGVYHVYYYTDSNGGWSRCGRNHGRYWFDRFNGPR